MSFCTHTSLLWTYWWFVEHVSQRVLHNIGVRRVVSAAYITHLHLTQSVDELTKKIYIKSGTDIASWGIQMLMSLKSEIKKE